MDKAEHRLGKIEDQQLAEKTGGLARMDWRPHK